MKSLTVVSGLVMNASGGFVMKITARSCIAKYTLPKRIKRPGTRSKTVTSSKYLGYKKERKKKYMLTNVLVESCIFEHSIPSHIGSRNVLRIDISYLN